jgi:hypothetical protein
VAVTVVSKKRERESRDEYNGRVHILLVASNFEKTLLYSKHNLSVIVFHPLTAKMAIGNFPTRNTSPDPLLFREKLSISVLVPLHGGEFFPIPRPTGNGDTMRIVVSDREW